MPKRVNNSKKNFELTGWLKKLSTGSEKKEAGPELKLHEEFPGMDRIGRYEIRKKLGHGTMGVVFLCRDPFINRNVSIKVSRPGGGLGKREADKFRELFFLEAQSAGRLVHPNIVAVYDAGMHEEYCYITMEYVNGPDFRKFCSKGGMLPVGKALKCISAACKGLDYAHQKGLVHRDIKPSNLMINKAGYVKITDFGLARVRSGHGSQEGIVGSPSYMSPEQIKEKNIDHKADIFSLGCVLYEILSGKVAFQGENLFSTMYKIAEEDPVPIREVRPELPQVITKILEKALSKDPSRRYQTCNDFDYDLKVAIRGLREEEKSQEIDDMVDYVLGNPFFEDLTKDQVNEILKTSMISSVQKGDIVVSEGEVDDSFFIILSGEVIVEKNGQKIAHIGRGECFGEIAYLSSQVRAASVRAETDCVLLKISGTLLNSSSKDIQLLFMKKFAKTLIERLTKSQATAGEVV